jgi:16S rRNA (guanine966-N2)-methyltransferase
MIVTNDMRIIAGTYRSRLLKSLKGAALRPTSDRLRETLFNVLGPSVEGSRFLDVFAGTGAVGIETLSRGATQAVFIENHGPAANLIRRNLESLGLRSGYQILAEDALRGLSRLARKHRPGDPGFDLIFIDPPYAASGEYDRVLRFLGVATFLAPRATVIAEHRRTAELPAQFGALHRFRVLRQGDAALTFYRTEKTFDVGPSLE